MNGSRLKTTLSVRVLISLLLMLCVVAFASEKTYAECRTVPGGQQICDDENGNPQPPGPPPPSSSGSWCESKIDTGHIESEECFVDNQKKLKDRGINVTPEGYEKAINDCVASNGADSGDCANAYVNCMIESSNNANCSNSEYVSAIAESGGCNNGKLTGGSDRIATCTPISKDNLNEIEKREQALYDSTTDACKAKNPEEQKICADAALAAKNECRVAAGGKLSEKTDLDAYTECLKKSVQSKANDNKEMCEGAGGIYVERDYLDTVPGSNSDVTKGCKYQESDLINQQACEAKGYKWQRTGGGANRDDYGCVDPNENKEPCEGHGGGQPDENGECPDGTKPDEAETPDGSVAPVSEYCGQARVNLLSCTESQDQQGAVPLNNILRIIIMVLSVLVGIAAVGGLAWASLQYAKAEDNSGAVSEARTLIRNIVIGILLYGFLVVIINWLVPGGVIGTGGGSGGGWFS